MKVLIVGSDKSYAIEHFYVKYLRKLDVDVKLYPSNRIFQDYYFSSFFNKLLYRLGCSRIIQTINENLIIEAEAFCPDIIFIFKGMEIYPSALKQIKKMGIKLVNYNPDHPFIFSGRGSGNKLVSQSVHIYDLYFTYSNEIRKEIERKVNVSTELLPFGHDIDESVYISCSSQEEIIKLCFIGNPDKKRIAFLLQLADRGIKIDLYGHEWRKYIHHNNIECFDALYNEALFKCIYRYRIQLNLMRIHNESSHNMRSFEVPAIGGILLAPDTPDHRKYFDEGNEVFLFRNIDECCKKIDYLLSITQKKAAEIRIAAYKKSQQAGYQYQHRAAFVKDCFLKLINN